jgi:hypothetical protein
MTADPDNDLNPKWRNELRAMKQSPEAPPWLENRIADALAGRGLIHRGIYAPRSQRRARWIWPLTSAAACVLCFAAGIEYATPRPYPQPAPTGNRYILLLTRTDNVVASGSPEEAVLAREYSAWAQQQRRAGNLLSGERLQDDSITLSGAGGHSEIRGSDTNLGGFFLVSAANLDSAIAIARTCPHLQHGGTVVIRPIDPTPPPPSAH